MPIQRRELEDLGFHYSHDVFVEADMPDFQSINEPRADASVYVWVSPAAGMVDELDVLYVGKAGRGVSKRLREHRGGFVNSGTGRENRRLISEWIATGRSIMVFSRVSAIQEIFGVPVSIYSTEEQALCERFVPRWNRAVFPRAAAQPVPPVDAQAQVFGRAVVPSPAAVPLFDQMAFGDEVAAFYSELPAEKQVQFAHLLDLLQQRDPAAGYKIVEGYAHQPSGYNKKRMLVFGMITPGGGRAMDPVGRIPLVDKERNPLTIIFQASSRAPGLDAARFDDSSSGCWRPLDLAHFLENVETYLR